MKRVRWTLALVLLVLLVLAGAVGALLLRELQGAGEEGAAAARAPAAASAAAQADLRARGAYLARVGNCMGCHTARGGAPYAGGRPIETPFGTLYGPNLTPDAQTGLGRWTADDFWRALHHGRARDGRLLYPAFPYPDYTHVTRADADAIYAYLQSLPPVAQPSRAHALRFPYDTQLALAAWRVLFFTPGRGDGAAADPARDAQWNRGAYLVNGLAHCGACHTPRNLLGASRADRALGGGLIPAQNWYAPALDAASEAGVAHWPLDDVVALLRTGVTRAASATPQASVSGPMAEVVFGSTQYLSEEDARAMAVYLQALPERAAPPAPPIAAPPRRLMQRGAEIYHDHCAQCHGAQGQGERGAFPALAGNRAVLLAEPTNLVRMILQGGYAPATAGNPRPYGMPPYHQLLGDEDVAAVATFVRNAWGNHAAALDTIDVYHVRERR
ncbi:cytochrome c [Extensimonas vulgaris]|uniref:Cytochrome c n=1 Tax=Extensimonas vulgaris TaxID=1031594 RepID=A0A369API3_9BURK|nr:cytochrome c [Extensimonas vulgaris]RCX10117.1 cytochrome c [Extensimonas vulgaris]TWI39698.1 cytochrome c [Extensimonas vulgaris]TXD17267.1 c-type cytochrome [Extensimonas vulgaris]